MRKMLERKIAGLALSMTIAATILFGTGIDSFAYTQTTGTVTSDNVKVRSSASTTASQVSSLKNGDTVDIVDEAKDASGYVWYKIFVNKSEYGYVRSDLVKKAGGSSSESTSTSTESKPASLPETSVTSTEQKVGTITSESVNVRQGAGTAYDSVGKVLKGDTVTITGEATGTDNKTWYQVTFGASGKTGFVRSDLLQVSDAAPVEENPEGAEAGEVAEGENAEGEQSEEQSQASTTVVSDAGDGTYSLVYTTDENGTGIWYLYDNAGGYRVKVNELIEAAQSASQVNELRKTNKNYKKIVIALAIVIAALIAGVVILALKLRDSLYYEDEEEEEYDRYSTPSRNRESRGRDADVDRTMRRPRDEEKATRTVEPERPVRRPASDERTVTPTRRSAEEQYAERPVRRAERSDNGMQTERPVRRPERNDEYEAERAPRREARPVAEDREARRPATSSARRPERPERPEREEQREPQQAPKRKSRNFIGDDDDFEFEFLDLDD